VVKFFAFTASNTSQNLGITVQVNSGATYPVQVGAYNDGGGWNWLLPSNAWKVGTTLIDAKKIELNTEINSINAELDWISQTLSNVDVSDKTIYLPSLTATSFGLIATISGSFNIFTQVRALSTSTSHDACNTGSTTVSSSLKKTTVFGPWVTNPNAWLGYHWLSNVVVKRTDTNVTLSEGVDYEVDYFGGKLYSYNLDNVSVSVTFNYKKERYDLIQYNLVNNTVNVKKGTERIHDAQEYMPAPDNGGWKGLFTVLVVGNEIKGIQPIYKTNGIGGDFYKMPDELATIKYHNAKCLRKTKLKLQNSDPLKIVGWGDSITAINGGSDTTSPNGNRDLLSYPMTNLPRETVELYTAITSDSFGEHVKIGWNWYLKSLFETKFGSTVTYLNYGLSGMGSGQGVDPVNIANINANNADLIVMCWGMNDQLSTDTYPNLINIAKQFIANGSEVVIMPVPRTPKINNITPILGTETDYNTNLLRCYQAALESGSAFVPAHLYVGYNSDNSIGLHSMHYCSSNLVNHPGLHELKIYGKLLCSLFD
ncbi:SGNH/GDSL hydrolase family protein, partial [Acinetobacter baumannii]